MRNKYAPPKVRCPCCKAGLFATYYDLAQHILGTDDEAHENARIWARKWAEREDRLNVPAGDYLSKRAAKVAAIKARNPDGICPVCHKPYEGGKAKEVCQC